MPSAGRHLTPEQRLELVTLSASGLGSLAIARATGIHYQTVSRWRDRWKAGGVSDLEGRPTGPKTNSRRRPEGVVSTIVEMRQAGRSRKEIMAATGFSTFVVDGVLREQGLGKRKKVDLGSPPSDPTPPAPPMPAGTLKQTEPQYCILHRMFYKGATYRQMGEAIGRSHGNVGTMLKRLGLRRADQPRATQSQPPRPADPKRTASLNLPKDKRRAEEVARQRERRHRIAVRSIEQVQVRGLPMGVYRRHNSFIAKLGSLRIGTFPTIEAAVRARTEAARVAGKRAKKTT